MANMAPNTAKSTPNPRVTSSGTMIGATMSTELAPAFVKNLAEEAAWRGYLTEELLSNGTQRLPLNLGVGLTWGTWHLPYYLFFLPEEQMRQVLDIDRPVVGAITTAAYVAVGALVRRLGRESVTSSSRRK